MLSYSITQGNFLRYTYDNLFTIISTVITNDLNLL